MPAISIVIPTLNEAKELPETLRRAKSLDGLKEIIVVDAGSTDSTQDIAREAGCMTLECEPSRGRQLRLGAELAKGEIVLLLHADTWLPENAASIITETLPNQASSQAPLQTLSRPRCITWFSHSLLALWKFANKFFGDQAIFVERNALEHAAGVPNVPLMEEFDLCKYLGRHGKLSLAHASVLTSARKFSEEGTMTTYWRMAYCLTRYTLSASPQRSKEIYDPRNARLKN